MITYIQQKGFTLIEAMITVAIVSILAATAMPSYNNFRLKGNRSDGVAMLNEIMQAEERFAAANNTYTEDITTLGYTANQLSEQAFYQISAGTCGAGSSLATCVKLTATAQGRQTNDKNGNGGHLSLNSRGDRLGF